MDAIKTASKKEIQKTAEAAGDLISKKNSDKITNASKKSLSCLQNDDGNGEIKETKKDTYLQKKDNKLSMNYGQYKNIIMEHQNIANLLDNGASNETSQFRTKNWAKINDDSRGGYTTGKDIKFKTTMPRSRLCGHADAYILVKGTITVTGTGDDAAAR